MTETTARIRWEDEPTGDGDVYVIASKGYAGAIEEPAFRIYRPDEVHDNWLLSVRLTGGSKFFYGTSSDELKAEAERWLERFVSSIGAVFLDDIEPLRKDQEAAPEAAGEKE